MNNQRGLRHLCSLVILRRPGHAWPLLLGANRDEMRERPWEPPGRHWPDRPGVVAGRDLLSGGSWMGVNDDGLVAAVLNRQGSLGPAAGKRSRGELVLEALDHAEAVEAARALAEVDPGAYRSFNLVVADNQDAFWLRHIGEDATEVVAQALPPGLSMLTAHDRNDTRSSPRTRLYLPRFRAAAAPDPDSGDWRAWEELLRGREAEPGAGPAGAMAVERPDGFGTVSSSLLALPAAFGRRPLWRFAAGMPGVVGFSPVDLG